MSGKPHDYIDTAWMTKEQADFVRRMRVDEGATWRAVAQLCADEWGHDYGGSQPAGEDLCWRAASFFGEDWDAPPWNG